MNCNDNLSPRDVQELAGHSNINTTYKYVHSSKKRIKENATNLFESLTRESLYKNGNDNLVVSISHIATIMNYKKTAYAILNDKVNKNNIDEVLE